MPTQFIDWGKNEELVARIFSYIHSNIFMLPHLQTQKNAIASIVANQ